MQVPFSSTQCTLTVFRFVVNAANPDFHPQGSGVNKAINDAAGTYLHAETKKLYSKAEVRHVFFVPEAKVGKAYRVELPKESPLRKNEGVQYIIHVVGPNMNPQRPNCLFGDYKQGCALLTQCYQSLLTSYYDIVE